MMESAADGPGGKQEVLELIERRTKIQQWLGGLESQRGSAPERILERVRADYESRLADTLAELATHLDELRTQLDRASEKAAIAEREHSDASDALEEGRLRHSIGEVPTEEWTERQNQLLEAVERAGEAEEAARAEAERLRELLGRLSDDGQAPSPAPVTQAVEPVESVEEVTFVDPDQTVEARETVGEAERPSDSQAFLVEIDRALSESGAENQEQGTASFEVQDSNVDAGEEDPGTAPKPGLKCGECGYTNDLSAWFCGVCGADVG